MCQVGCAPQLQLYSLLWRMQRWVMAGEMECKLPRPVGRLEGVAWIPWRKDSTINLYQSSTDGEWCSLWILVWLMWPSSQHSQDLHLSKDAQKDFQGINQVPSTFKHIQPYSPAQKTFDYKTFDVLASWVSFNQWKGLRNHREWIQNISVGWYSCAGSPKWHWPRGCHVVITRPGYGFSLILTVHSHGE